MLWGWTALCCAATAADASPRVPCSVACRDKRVVREADSEADVWWGKGSPNYEMDEQ